VKGLPLNVRRERLPVEVWEGHHLEVGGEDGQVVSAIIDDAETEAVRQRIEEKIERLRRREHLKS
jgi:hypothetical protein